MTPAAPDSRLQRVLAQLAGYPAEALGAAESVWRTRDPAAADRLLHAVLAHHLPPSPARPPLGELPDTADLVQQVGLDSLATVEMGFLLEGLFETKISDEELRGLRQLGDLRALIRAKVAALPA